MSNHPFADKLYKWMQDTTQPLWILGYDDWEQIYNIDGVYWSQVIAVHVGDNPPTVKRIPAKTLICGITIRDLAVECELTPFVEFYIPHVIKGYEMISDASNNYSLMQTLATKGILYRTPEEAKKASEVLFDI